MNIHTLQYVAHTSFTWLSSVKKSTYLVEKKTRYNHISILGLIVIVTVSRMVVMMMMMRRRRRRIIINYHRQRQCAWLRGLLGRHGDAALAPLPHCCEHPQNTQRKMSGQMRCPKILGRKKKIGLARSEKCYGKINIKFTWGFSGFICLEKTSNRQLPSFIFKSL